MIDRCCRPCKFIVNQVAALLAIGYHQSPMIRSVCFACKILGIIVEFWHKLEVVIVNWTLL